jgi:hypothetical protein
MVARDERFGDDWVALVGPRLTMANAEADLSRLPARMTTGGRAIRTFYDCAGRRHSPATLASSHVGRTPRNKGLRYPPDPSTVEEIIAVMNCAGDDAAACAFGTSRLTLAQ